MVLNSDSDTDSLPDLDFGFASTTIKTTPTASINLSKRPAGDDNGGDTLRRPQKKGRSKKLDLAMSAIGNIALEQEILNYKAELLESPEEPQDVKLTLTEDVLAQAVNDDEDPDKARRLFVAMQRASAGQTEDVFHFFHEDKVSRPASSPFPAGSLPQYRWTSSFRGEETTILH